jgi:transcriptional regulator with XRE-family HTH domain
MQDYDVFPEDRRFAIDRLRELRKAHGLKSHEISEILHAHPSYWSTIETRKHIPSVRKLVIVTTALGINLEILYGSEEVFRELPKIKLYRLKEEYKKIRTEIKALEKEMLVTKNDRI